MSPGRQRWPQVSWAVDQDPSSQLGEEAGDFTRRVLAAAWAAERRRLRLSVYFCGDEEISELHGRFLGDPTATDVISFPYGQGPPGGAQPQGELVVNRERAVKVAPRHGNSVAAEIALYLVHGALHLLGYDDRDAAALTRMKEAEQRVLARLGLEVGDRQ